MKISGNNLLNVTLDLIEELASARRELALLAASRDMGLLGNVRFDVHSREWIIPDPVEPAQMQEEIPNA